MVVVEIAVACRSSENLRGSPPLSCQNYTFSGGFLGSCLSLAGSQSYLILPFFTLLFLMLFFVSVRKSLQAFKGPWLSIPEASSWSGQPVLIFSLEFRYTRGLYKVSPCVHTFCLYSACICTRVVLVIVACLDMLLFVQSGEVIPSFDKKYSSQVFESRFEQLVG
jgi:hypothetical protein